MANNTKAYTNDNPIGIFDSGVGGLTVVKEVIKVLPNENIIYFGDTARVPYGSKSKDTITKYAKQIMSFLLTQNVKAVIIACNTVSSNSYNELTAMFDLPIIEVVRPAVSQCLSNTSLNKIGVIGTERTVASGAYERIIKESNTDIKVYTKACPLFVPLAEEGWTNNEIAELTAKMYLDELVKKDIDALILGCTHYPLLKECIQKAIGKTLIINPAEATALEIKNYLDKNNLLNLSQTIGNYKFYASDNTAKFNKICKLVLGEEYESEIVSVD